MTNPAKRRSRRPRRGTPDSHIPQHSSVSTSREAYQETRRWLLAQHGPTCAYCGVTSNPRNITLDHVTPRKGQTAYDRRDNLVLACKRCNSAKADKPFLMYLLAQRARATNLARYGQHLSDGILDIVRPLAGEYAGPPPRLEMHPGSHAERPLSGYAPRPRIRYGGDDDEDSPYSDSPYRATA